MSANYKCRLMSESDLNLISNFLENLPDKNEGSLIYFNPMFDREIFSEAFIRYQLYSFNGEFIIGECNGVVCDMIGFSVPSSYKSTVLDISFVVCKENSKHLAELMDFAKCNLASKALNKPRKFKIMLQDLQMNHLLEQMGFNYELKCEDELGWGIPVFVYSKTI